MLIRGNKLTNQIMMSARIAKLIITTQANKEKRTWQILDLIQAARFWRIIIIRRIRCQFKLQITTKSRSESLKNWASSQPTKEAKIQWSLTKIIRSTFWCTQRGTTSKCIQTNLPSTITCSWTMIQIRKAIKNIICQMYQPGYTLF